MHEIGNTKQHFAGGTAGVTIVELKASFLLLFENEAKWLCYFYLWSSIETSISQLSGVNKNPFTNSFPF